MVVDRYDEDWARLAMGYVGVASRRRALLGRLPSGGERAVRACLANRAPNGTAGRALRGALQRFRLTEAAAEVDGGPIEGYRDCIVLAPSQHLWLRGDSRDPAAR